MRFQSAQRNLGTRAGAGTTFGDVGEPRSMASAAFGDVGVSLLVAGAIFGDVGVRLFVAGAIFGDVGVSLWVAGTGTTFGDVGMALFQQAQHFANFCKIAGARNIVFSNAKYVSKARKVTSANGRVRDDQFMFGSWSNGPPL